MTASTQRPGPTLLIVDHQDWSSRSLESVLAINGYRVIRVRSAHRALEATKAQQPDLLFINSTLPDGDGIGLCWNVRRDARFGAGLPILLTAPEPPSRTQRLAALRAGAWEFVSYPIDPEELLLKVHSYVQARLQWADRKNQAG